MFKGPICVWASLLPLLAQEVPAGKVVERVACRADDRQSYALYLPSTYTPERSWPILYCLDPGARGRFGVVGGFIG